MGLRKSIFAAVYDPMSRSSEDAGVRDMRRRLLADARGSVLEIGAGTGANLAHYGSGVESLVVSEPEPAMLRRLQSKAQEELPLAEIVQAPAEDLPFEDDSFDAVVSTLVLCGVADQARSLREVQRVLRPGGSLLFLEHVRSDDPTLARFQDRMNWLNRIVVDCDCNRQTLATIEAAGFTVSRIEHSELPKAPKFVRPLILGSAVADH
ncbi:MAG TPA: class I SAM-dependent methyltransferase [Gaiellaceae bacterium]|nr:class I SAM-dependent methyltransferase [Gaiellaceae bacterium]